MPIQAIIFDLDGTLLDTLADITDSANQVLMDLHMPIHPEQDYRLFVGEGVARLFERALPDSQRTPAQIATCVGRFRAEYGGRWNCRSRPYPGISDLLATLTNRQLLLAVLSNKPHEFTRACIAHFFPQTEFRAVLGQRDSTPAKPHPAGALEIAAELGLTAADCAFVGDSAIDMQTASRAGMFAVGVAWGFRPVAELLANGAECILQQPAELMEVLARATPDRERRQSSK